MQRYFVCFDADIDDDPPRTLNAVVGFIGPFDPDVLLNELRRETRIQVLAEGNVLRSLHIVSMCPIVTHTMDIGKKPSAHVDSFH